MSVLSSHSRLFHRNFIIFFLQWVSDGNVERRRGVTSVILLDRDVARFLVGPFDLMLLLSDSGKTGGLSRVGQDVPCVVVAEQERGAVVAANGMVAEDIHFGAAHFALVAEGGTGRGPTKKRHTQTELEGSAELVGLQCETKTWNRRCKQPVAGVWHRAGKHQVVAARAGFGHQLLKYGLVPLCREQLLHALLRLQIG